MANQKISQLDPIGTIDVNQDSFVVVDYSENLTKRTNLANIGQRVLEANTTTNLAEGTNLYFTNTRVYTKVKASLIAGSNTSITFDDINQTITIASQGNVQSVNGETGAVVLDTDNIGEGVTNLYYTDARAEAAAPVQSVNGEIGAVTVQPTLISGSNIKTINSNSLLGSGDITVASNWGTIGGTLSNQTDLQNALNAKQIIPYIQPNQASPVIHASDDINTGVNWTLADTLDLVAGGSSKVRINQTGVTNITVNNSTYISGTELGYLDGVTNNIQTQFNGKQATLVSGTNIKTINGTSVLGSGDITIEQPTPTGSNLYLFYNY